MTSEAEQALYDQARGFVEDGFKKVIKEKNEWADSIAILQLCDYDERKSDKKVPDLRALVAYIQNAANHIVLHTYKITTPDTIVLQNLKENNIGEQIKVDIENRFSVDYAASAKDFYDFVKRMAELQGTFNIRYQKPETQNERIAT
jgi:hypothetical protein